MRDLKICGPANRWARRERERESCSLKDTSANEVSAINNEIKSYQAMYSMRITIA